MNQLNKRGRRYSIAESLDPNVGTEQFTQPEGHDFVSGPPSVLGGVREWVTHRRPLDVQSPDRGRGLFAQGGKGNLSGTKTLPDTRSII